MLASVSETKPPFAQSSEALLAGARAGNDAALERLLERHLDTVRAYVRLHSGALVRAHDSASDLAQ